MYPAECSRNFPAAQMCYEEKINANFLIIQCKQSNAVSRRIVVVRNWKNLIIIIFPVNLFRTSPSSLTSFKKDDNVLCMSIENFLFFSFNFLLNL